MLSLAGGYDQYIHGIHKIRVSRINIILAARMPKEPFITQKNRMGSKKQKTKTMASKSTKATQIQTVRIFRKIHRISGSLFFLFFFIIAVTGLLLGWKKNSGGLLRPESYSGTSTDLKEWLPLDSLHANACAFLRDSVSADLSPELNRIDIRKNKGMVKFVFAHHYHGVQLDGATGKLLQIEKRRSDLIEDIHDGSILDRYLGTSGEQVKLIYTSLMGLALLVFTVTGFWLWYGPKKLKKTNTRQ
jgi:uncharacterized iron-regulated membrane protein